jgi:hypothetical protein
MTRENAQKVEGRPFGEVCGEPAGRRSHDVSEGQAAASIWPGGLDKLDAVGGEDGSPCGLAV